jgi:hypothetical protein
LKCPHRRLRGSYQRKLPDEGERTRGGPGDRLPTSEVETETTGAIRELWLR